MKNIPFALLSCVALLSAAQTTPTSGSLKHRQFYASHDRLWFGVQKAKTENLSQKFSFNVPTHPSQGLAFNVPTHPSTRMG